MDNKEKYTKEQYEAFRNMCYQRAIQIWWEIRPTIVPSSMLNIITDDDDKLYMEYMDARENIIEEMFSAQEELYTLGNEVDGVRAVPNEENEEVVATYGADVVHRARKTYEIFNEQLRVYQSKKKENPDAKDAYYEKFEKREDELIRKRKSTPRAKKESGQ
jgi:hypothetical protein